MSTSSTSNAPRSRRRRVLGLSGLSAPAGASPAMRAETARRTHQTQRAHRTLLATLAYLQAGWEHLRAQQQQLALARKRLAAARQRFRRQRTQYALLVGFVVAWMQALQARAALLDAHEATLREREGLLASRESDLVRREAAEAAQATSDASPAEAQADQGREFLPSTLPALQAATQAATQQIPPVSASASASGYTMDDSLAGADTPTPPGALPKPRRWDEIDAILDALRTPIGPAIAASALLDAVDTPVSSAEAPPHPGAEPDAPSPSPQAATRQTMPGPVDREEPSAGTAVASSTGASAAISAGTDGSPAKEGQIAAIGTPAIPPAPPARATATATVATAAQWWGTHRWPFSSEWLTYRVGNDPRAILRLRRSLEIGREEAQSHLSALAGVRWALGVSTKALSPAEADQLRRWLTQQAEATLGLIALDGWCAALRMRSQGALVHWPDRWEDPATVAWPGPRFLRTGLGASASAARSASAASAGTPDREVATVAIWDLPLITPSAVFAGTFPGRWNRSRR